MSSTALKGATLLVFVVIQINGPAFHALAERRLYRELLALTVESYLQKLLHFVLSRYSCS